MKNDKKSYVPVNFVTSIEKNSFPNTDKKKRDKKQWKYYKVCQNESYQNEIKVIWCEMWEYDKKSTFIYSFL